MRIATWNLQSDKPLPTERRGAFLAAINEINADVWVLTETWEHFKIPEPFHRIAETPQTASLVPLDRRWVAIWTRLSARLLRVADNSEQMACIRIEQAGWPDLIVVGTVLPRLADGGGSAFCRALRAQALEWERLWTDRQSGVFCVAGDFNQPLAGSLAGFSQAGYDALSTSLNGLGLSCCTRDLPGQAGHSDRTIDHLCFGDVAPPLSVGEAQHFPAPLLTGRVGCISDHDCYYVDLDFPA